MTGGPNVLWTEAELELLRRHYQPGRSAECLQLLPGRSQGAIVQRANIEGLGRKKQAWKGAEVSILKRHYPIGGTAACLPLLPGRRAHQIYMKVVQLGLKAPRAFDVAKVLGEAALLREENRRLRGRLAAAEDRARREYFRAERLSGAIDGSPLEAVA
jgi:hypothetical protein